MSESMSQDADACLVSIEVDGRQRYIFETDKLQEMLGGSRLIDATRSRAQELFTHDRRLFILSPVSGEIRAWCGHDDRDALLAATWALREWLDDAGIAHTIAFCDGIDRRHFEADSDRWKDANLAEKAHRAIAQRVRVLKHGKGGADAQPRCSLFAACEIHGLDAATLWQPGMNREGEERRELVGSRAAAKLAAWRNGRRRFLHDLLATPVLARLADLRPALHARLSKPPGITFPDLSESIAAESRGDQYIAFLCADGDRMGQVLANLSWNDPRWRSRADAVSCPFERNRAFSRALDAAVTGALGDAMAIACLPDTAEGKVALDRLEEAAATRPDQPAALDVRVLPQLAGGDDLWIVAAREIALPLAIELGHRYAATAQDPAHHHGVIDTARRLAGEKQALTLSFGIAFAKAGYPVQAMVEAAEDLLRSAKKLRKGALKGEGRPKPIDGSEQGCIDWHWIDSSLSEDVGTARSRRRYDDAGTVMHLTTRPWMLDEAAQFVDAARVLSRLPRRKREQIEAIVWRGRALSLLAWESWWKSLQPSERTCFEEANRRLPEPLKLERPGEDPWRNLGSPDQPRWVTPLVDLLELHHVLGLAGEQAADTHPAATVIVETTNAPA